MDDASTLVATREIDAVVEMMLSATYHYQQPLLLDDSTGRHISDRLQRLFRHFFILIVAPFLTITLNPSLSYRCLAGLSSNVVNSITASWFAVPAQTEAAKN